MEMLKTNGLRLAILAITVFGLMFFTSKVVLAQSYQNPCEGCSKEDVESGSEDDMGFVYEEGVSAYYVDYFDKSIPQLGGKKGKFYISTPLSIKTALPIPVSEGADYVSGVTAYVDGKKTKDLSLPTDCSLKTTGGAKELICTYVFPIDSDSYEQFAAGGYDFWSDVVIEYRLADGRFAPVRIDGMGNYYISLYATTPWDRPVGYFEKDYLDIYEPSDGTADINVRVRSDLKVSKIEFYLDGSLEATVSTESQTKQDIAYKPDMVNIFTHTWDFSDVENGEYEWQARIYDKDGNYSTAYFDEYGEGTLHVYKYVYEDEGNCKLVQDALGNIMQSLIDRRNAELATIELIAGKIQAYYLENLSGLQDSNDAFDETNTANSEVYTALTELAGAGSYNCEEATDEQITSFIAMQTSVVDALNAYVDSIISLIDSIVTEGE